MRVVYDRLAEKQLALARHPFFRYLHGDTPVHALFSFAPTMAFWTLAFQDSLRLNERLTRDPEIRRVVHRHRAEEVGHDTWYMHDLHELGQSLPDLRTLFGANHSQTRDATYLLMAEVVRATSDYERLIILLAFEALASPFLKDSSEYCKRMGLDNTLSYFSSTHLDAEKNHDDYEQRMHAILDSANLSEEECQRACQVVDRLYEACVTLLDGFEAIVSEALRATPIISQPGPKVDGQGHAEPPALAAA